MSLNLDPERNEINALFKLAGDLQDRRILEIGSGNGRLTWRYAAQAGQVLGIDPNPERVAHAQKTMPADFLKHVSLLESSLADYQRDHQGPPFDIALMSWSL